MLFRSIDAEDIVDDSDILSVDAFNFELNNGLRVFFGRVDEAGSGESTASDFAEVSPRFSGAFPLDGVSASSSWRALKDKARRKRLLRPLRGPPDVESFILRRSLSSRDTRFSATVKLP